MLSIWFRNIAGSSGGALPSLILTSGFVNLLALAAPVFVLQVYDRVVFYEGRTTLAGLTMGISIALLFDFVFRQSRSRLIQSAALRLDVTLGKTLFRKLLRLPLQAIEARNSAQWQNFFRDVQLVRNALAGPPLLNLIDLLFAVIFLGAIFLIAPSVAWVVLFFVPIFLAISIWSGFSIAAATARERSSLIARDSLVNELTAARQTVKSLALEEAMDRMWQDRHGEAITQSKRRGGRSDRFQNMAYTMSMATTVALTTVGALAIMRQDLTIGALIATNMLATRIFSPFVQLVGTWRALSDARQAAQRLDVLFGEDEEAGQSTLPMAQPQGNILLDQVNFAFQPNARFAIADLNLRIGPAGLHALTGPMGSGKTTLLKLIAGLYRPASGRVLIDGADIAQFARADIAGHIGYLPQEIVLFSGTIRDNLTLVRPDADDEEIARAAKLAGAHDFIVDLPDGYGTDIGEWGGYMSGGQRQRLALARCMMGDPAILLLDEPTSHLDPESARALAEALARLSRDHTILVATHNPGLMRMADTIARMQQGKIVMSGPAQRMLAAMGLEAPPTPAVPITGGSHGPT